MLQAFVFERVGIVVGDIYFLDPEPHPGQEGPEHGVRLELRVFDRGELRGTIYSAQPIEVGRPIWRVDLLEAVDGKPGSFNRTHHHPQFNSWDPGPRVFLRELSADPLGWLAGQLADLPAVLDRAGVPQDVADPTDAASLRDIAPAIVGVAGLMLDKVQSGELGLAPDGEAAGSIRNGWLLSPGGMTPRTPVRVRSPAIVADASSLPVKGPRRADRTAAPVETRLCFRRPIQGVAVVARDESAIGTIGVLTIATRGQAGPGEVLIRIRGGVERFLAWSQSPIPRGATVLVIDNRGKRTVDVMEWTDPLGEAPTIPSSSEVPRSGE
jgi:hypothetical protein